jgi:hypothetical protein
MTMLFGAKGSRPVFAAAALFASICAPRLAAAFEAVPYTPLPTLAANPWAGTPMGAWSGFAARTDFAGLPAGGVFARTAGYNQLVGKNLLLGVATTSFTSPVAFGSGPAFGTDFSATSMRLTYNMGAFKPFFTAGAGFARPNVFGGANFAIPADPLANIHDSKSFTSVGAGFDYQVSNGLSVGVAVSAGSGQALRGPGALWP